MSELVSIGGDDALVDVAADSYFRMRAKGCPPGITSSTRSYDQQLDWYNHQGEPGYPAKAADPRTSKHVWRPTDTKDKGARALDIPEPARTWVRTHGAEYGWMKDRVSGEPWHMEYEAANDKHKEDGVPLTPEDKTWIKSTIKTESEAAARSAIAKIYAEAASRETTTGRNFGNAIWKVDADNPTNKSILDKLVALQNTTKALVETSKATLEAVKALAALEGLTPAGVKAIAVATVNEIKAVWAK